MAYMSSPDEAGVEEQAPLMARSRADQYGMVSDLVMKQQQKRRASSLNLCFLVVGLLVPWGVFIANYASTCFCHAGPMGTCAMTPIVLTVLSVITGIVGAMGLLSLYTKSRDPTWFFLVCGMMIIALVTSSYFGSWNFRENFEPYYTNVDLNTYHDVDPAASSGTQIMDAAFITFTKDAAPNVAGAMSFKNKYTYCAAPITATNDTSLALGEYNFWAVGINCCSKARVDFTCGAVGSARAKSGLRVGKDAGFYRLAVQQAEAAYQIKAPHPLFVLWTEDPVAQLENWRDTGMRWFTIGIFIHLVVQAFLCAGITLAMLWKLF